MIMSSLRDINPIYQDVQQRLARERPTVVKLFLSAKSNSRMMIINNNE